MHLIPTRPAERALPVGAKLRGGAEAAKQLEGAPCDARIGEVEMNGDLAAAAEVQATGRVEQARELREPVAVRCRGDMHELSAKLLRKRTLRSGPPLGRRRHSRCPSRARSLRLYSTPRSP